MSISYAGYGTGLPFPVSHKADDGGPFTVWDGVSWTSSDYAPGAVPANDSGNPYVVGPGTRHPIRFSLSEYAEFYWRVRTHSITVAGLDASVPRAASWSDDTWEATQSGETYIFGRELLYVDPTTINEAQLLSNMSEAVRIVEWSTLRGGQWTGAAPMDGSVIWRLDDGSVFNSSPTRLSFYCLCLFNQTRFADGSYWPQIDIELGFLSEDFGLLSGLFVTSYAARKPPRASGLPNYVTPQSSATFKIHNYPTIPLYHHSEAGYVSGSFVMGSKSFWPYNGRWNPADGTPT